MSSLWTPGGERPVPPASAQSPEAGRGAAPPEPSEEELRAELAAMQQQLARTPAAVVVANHCFGLFELAALHLGLQPPQLDQAQLAIDALAAVVEGLDGRLAEAEPQLKQGLAQLRMAFVQIRAANLGAPGAPGAPGTATPSEEA